MHHFRKKLDAPVESIFMSPFQNQILKMKTARFGHRPENVARKTGSVWGGENQALSTDPAEVYRAEQAEDGSPVYDTQERTYHWFGWTPHIEERATDWNNRDKIDRDKTLATASHLPTKKKKLPLFATETDSPAKKKKKSKRRYSTRKQKWTTL